MNFAYSLAGNFQVPCKFRIVSKSLASKPLPLRNAYAAKVCPNCEGWNCAAEEVCDMVEAEDESDVKVPSCSEKQTGCDLERFE